MSEVRTRFVQAMNRRMQGAPEAVQRVLRERLQQTLAEPGEPEAQRPRYPVAARSATPLGELNRHIQRAAHAGPELRSAERFRDSWSRISADEAVTQAQQRGPENAGPLNSHRLVLRTLGLMRELSPDYLRRFLMHAETLLWLEQAQARAQSPSRAKPLSARSRTARNAKKNPAPE